MKNILRSLALTMALIVFFGCSYFPVVGQGEKGNLNGVWKTVVTPRICATGAPVGPTFPGILLFAADGTMTGTSTAAASVYGLWRREPGLREYSFATLSLRFDAGNVVGSRRITQNVSVDETGNNFTSSGGFQDYDLNGNQIGSGCASSVGSRFE